ncbi:MAG: hypothetical protein EPO06_00735 [Burkholderiaceae bacterium]|nr:MAG: hypothetical protein EPO06_00735 [Burkholderiaceae bacterium]
MEHSGTHGWQEAFQSNPGQYPHRLAARFPHVVKRLSESWDSPELARACFRDLLTPQRPQRRGFPEEVYLEIFSLSQLFERLHKNKQPAADIYWNWVAN